MFITATELKSNLGRYLKLASEEDIFITRNGKPIAKLTHPKEVKLEAAKSLFGILPSDIDLAQAREERLERYEGSD